MALDYTDLFEDVGKLVKYYNAFAGDAQALSTDVDAIQVAFADEHQEAAIEGLRDSAEDNWLNEYVGRRETLAGYAANRLADRDSVLVEIAAISSDLGEVLSKLIEQMTADSESVNASSTVIGTVTANGGNEGDGTVLVTTLLDRATSPGTRAGVSFPSHHLYGDLESELTVTETMAVRCTADSFADGQTEGAESFSWEGGIADSQHGVETTEGSGNIGGIQAIHGQVAQFLTNADFELFTTTDTPDGWTLDAGAVTTNIKEATGSNAYHGDSGLNFLGDGATTDIKISQAIAAASLTAGKRYCVTCRVKADASVTNGDLTIQLEGTGYTAGSGEKISIAAGSLPTSWTLASFFVLLPEELPSDLALAILWDDTPTSAKNVYIDDIGFGPVNYGGGLGIVAVRGASPFVREDRFTFTVTATEGVVQKFFRRVFGVQLPSDDGGSETVADSVAT